MHKLNKAAGVGAALLILAAITTAQAVYAEEELYMWKGETSGPTSTEDYVDALNKIKKPTARFKMRGLGQTPAAAPAHGQGPDAISVYFTFDSDSLSPRTKEELDKLGSALAKEQFSRDRWLVEGHTDAAGSDVYNQWLSVRRANSVQDYLVVRYGISRAMLEIVGKGEHELYDRGNPQAGVNRRVRIKHLGAAPN